MTMIIITVVMITIMIIATMITIIITVTVIVVVVGRTDDKGNGDKSFMVFTPFRKALKLDPFRLVRNTT